MVVSSVKWFGGQLDITSNADIVAFNPTRKLVRVTTPGANGIVGPISKDAPYFRARPGFQCLVWNAGPSYFTIIDPDGDGVNQLVLPNRAFKLYLIQVPGAEIKWTGNLTLLLGSN